MHRRALAVACAGLVGASAAACLGYGSPVDDGDGVGPRLPDRPNVDDAAVIVDDPPIDPPPVVDGGAETSAADAANKPLRAFVSSATRAGNLGGLAGADQLCTMLAAAAGLGGTYRAWLSISGTDAIDRITSAGPWQLVTGEVVADTKAGLTTGTLKRLIDKDEKGATPPEAEDRVWTATGGNGRFTAPDCTGWTGGGSGLVGEARNNGANAWTALETEACGEVNRVYCLEL